MFILQNQDGYFLSKSGDWVDGREPNTLFRTTHKDEALNQLFESNSKDYSLRITIFDCEASSKKQPIIPEDQLPPPKLDTVETEEENNDTRENTLNSENFKDESLFANSSHA
ncbi:MAG: hypothetical protein ACRBBR_02320 [Cellvibrionaceae bacterium]